MLANIVKDKELYKNVEQEHLRRLKIDIDSWIKLMSSDSVFGDELMIFALSRTYQRQSVVFTSRGFWTTLGSDDPISVNRILEICDIKLLYVGLHMYGELRRKPFIPVTAQALLEAPDSILPSTTDSDSDTAPKAVDLTIKQQKQDSFSTTVHNDSSSTEGSESSTPYTKPGVSNCDRMNVQDQAMTSPSDSNTPSESLLVTDTVVDNNVNTVPETETRGDILGACGPVMTGNPIPINDVLGINIAYPELGLTTDVPSDKAIDHVKCSNFNLQTNNQEKTSFKSVNVPADTMSAKNYASAVTNSPVAMGKNNPTNGATSCNMLGKNLELTSLLVSPLMGLNSPENSAVTGVNEAELTPSDTSMPLEDESKNPIVGSKQNNTASNSVPSLKPVNTNLDHSSDVNICDSDCEMNVHGDPYLDASLSGALEKLSVTELSVIDTLVSLHMITENSTDYVHTDHNYYMMYRSNNMQEPLVAERTENLVTSACIFSTDDLQGSASQLNDCEMIILYMTSYSVQSTI